MSGSCRVHSGELVLRALTPRHENSPQCIGFIDEIIDPVAIDKWVEGGPRLRINLPEMFTRPTQPTCCTAQIIALTCASRYRGIAFMGIVFEDADGTQARTWDAAMTFIQRHDGHQIVMSIQHAAPRLHLGRSMLGRPRALGG